MYEFCRKDQLVGVVGQEVQDAVSELYLVSRMQLGFFANKVSERPAVMPLERMVLSDLG